MPEKSLRLFWPRDAVEAGEAAQHLVATGRGLLKFVLGDEAQRFCLLAGHIHWPYVVLAFQGDRVVGFAAIKRYGRGPYAPGFQAFSKTFGFWSGGWRWLLFVLLELRGWRSECYLYGLKVLPELRRQGIATALIEAVLQRAAEEGVRRLELEVSDRHTGARSLYLKQGFQEERELRLRGLAHWFGFSSLCLMVKEIDVSAGPRAGAG